MFIVLIIFSFSISTEKFKPMKRHHLFPLTEHLREYDNMRRPEPYPILHNCSSEKDNYPPQPDIPRPSFKRKSGADSN